MAKTTSKYAEAKHCTTLIPDTCNLFVTSAIEPESHCEVLHKMATSKVEKAYCALEFARTGAVVTVQRNSTRRFNKVESLEVLHKMATSKVEKAYCALEFARTGAVVTVQRNFTRRFNKPAPHRNCISCWVQQLQETGCLCSKKSPGRPQTPAVTVNRIQAAYSPTKSTRRASNELQIPQTTVWRILRKRQHFKQYKLQFLQTLKPETCPNDQ
ncbi:hypothetical protein C0J52_14665 [Blattella germanica]|nr:hypothetical protein C0J52_14665 [Blattella germanica]